VAGTAKLNAAVIPRRENAVRREITSDLIFSVIFKSPCHGFSPTPVKVIIYANVLVGA